MPYADENLTRYLAENPLLEKLSVKVAELDLCCWLVGGALRDGLLGRQVTDVDLVTIADPTPLAKNWAREQGGHWFWLDQGRRQSRVLMRSGEDEIYFDFAPLRAATLEQDLSLRDFTINAMVLPISSPLMDQQLFDPLGGREDLKSSCLRVCSENSLKDDPLRILKGIRHSVTLKLQIESKTEAQMYDLAGLLASSAGERKRNELSRMLASNNLEQVLSILDRCCLFDVLLGPPGDNFYIAQVISDLDGLTRAMDEWSVRSQLVNLLGEVFDEDLSRRTLFLFALMLRHYRTANLGQVLADQLRFSRRSVATLEALVYFDFDLFSEFGTLPDSNRARNLWLNDLGSTCVDQLLFFAAVHRPAYLRPHVLQAFVDDYTGSLVHGRIPDLLSGGEIRQLLPDLPDRQIGEFQKMIKRAEIAGELSTQEEARQLLLAEKPIDKS